MSDFDRFQSPGHHEEPTFVAYCAACGSEIYGSDYIEFTGTGEFAHDGCADEYMAAELGLARHYT